MRERQALDDRLLVLAPRGRDATLTVSILGDLGIACQACMDMTDMLSMLEEGAAGLLIAEEALGDSGALQRMIAALAGQPSWSDVPVVLFASPEKGARSRLIAALGNVTVLDRPLRPLTMVSAARAALRARRRQYQARGVMAEQALAVAQRDQFLAMLGHELRNPLGAIKLAIEMLDKVESTPHAILRRQT